MKYTEFASLLSDEPAHIAFLSTFQFDPEFFERQLISGCSSLTKARRIVVFMDEREWRELIQRDIQSRWLNRRYLVVPVRRSTGVFHPKLSLLLSETGGQVLCGSNNLTRSGCSRNLELLNSLQFDFVGDFEEEMLLATEAFRFFKQAAQDTDDAIGRIVAQWIEETAVTYGWLDRPGEIAESDRTVRLIHSYDGSLWEPLVDHLQDQPPDEFFIVSPFHDKRSDIALRLVDQWPDAKVNFVVQSGYTNLNAESLKSLKQVRLHEIQGGGLSRRVHAKLVAWRSSEGSGCLVGSANFTSAALHGRNVEACLLVKSSDDLVESLFDKELSKDEIEFEEFEPGANEEPDGTNHQPPLLQLSSVVLESDVKVQVGYSHTLSDEPSALRLAIRSAAEIRNRIQVAVPNRRQGEATVFLPENALTDVHGALLATLVAETANGQQQSDPLWIIQSHQLTYEPGEGSSSAKSRVEESGEGLAEYLEEIVEQNGIAAKIEFLSHLNIRFYDGVRSAVGRKFRIQMRDPFTFDSVPQWLIEARAQSADLNKWKEEIESFNQRHEKRRLRRHAEKGNINGIENFLDIMRTMVKLTYVNYRREDVPITRGHVIDLNTRCIELATSGVDDEHDPWDGYLYMMWNSLDGNVEALQEVLTETNYAAELRAVLLIAQCAGSLTDNKATGGNPKKRPRGQLKRWAKLLRDVLAECEIVEPSSEGVGGVLEQYRMFSDQGIEEMLNELPECVKNLED